MKHAVVVAAALATTVALAVVVVLDALESAGTPHSSPSTTERSLQMATDSVITLVTSRLEERAIGPQATVLPPNDTWRDFPRDVKRSSALHHLMGASAYDLNAARLFRDSLFNPTDKQLPYERRVEISGIVRHYAGLLQLLEPVVGQAMEFEGELAVKRGLLARHETLDAARAASKSIGLGAFARCDVSGIYVGRLGDLPRTSELVRFEWALREAMLYEIIEVFARYGCLAESHLIRVRGQIERLRRP